MPNSQKGFTLVEIAIVLVIIGLLLGGALKGQELINNAKVKNLANDFRNTPLLVYGYQDKFKALPGDDAAAFLHVGGSKASTPANSQGNGVIDGAWNSSTSTDESYLFWQHARRAGLASGPTDTGAADYMPKNAEGGAIGITSAANLPITGLRGSHFICSQGISGKLAKQLDITMDDGDTANGHMQAIANQTAPQSQAQSPIPLSTTGTGSVIDDSQTYTVCMGF